MLIIHDYETPSPKRWHLVISGMRNSWESWQKGDSVYEQYHYERIFALGEADKALANRLIKAGSDHSKFARQLDVCVDISAPSYWFREFDTYKIGTTANSTSQMHTVGKHPFAADMFSFEDLPEAYQWRMLQHLNILRDEWITAGKRKGPDATEWRAMLQAIPDSWMYRRCLTLNYQVLRAIYTSRKNHRLSEWREWCAWTEQLPYSELITLGVEKE